MILQFRLQCTLLRIIIKIITLLAIFFSSIYYLALSREPLMIFSFFQKKSYKSLFLQYKNIIHIWLVRHMRRSWIAICPIPNSTPKKAKKYQKTHQAKKNCICINITIFLWSRSLSPPAPPYHHHYHRHTVITSTHTNITNRMPLQKFTMHTYTIHSILIACFYVCVNVKVWENGFDCKMSTFSLKLNILDWCFLHTKRQDDHDDYFAKVMFYGLWECDYEPMSFSSYVVWWCVLNFTTIYTAALKWRGFGWFAFCVYSLCMCESNIMCAFGWMDDDDDFSCEKNRGEKEKGVMLGRLWNDGISQFDGW